MAGPHGNDSEGGAGAMRWGAAIGVGSAALAAALLYSRRPSRETVTSRLAESRDGEGSREPDLPPDMRTQT